MDAEHGTPAGEKGRDGAMTRLQQIPNVGPRVAEDLLKLGITRLQDAADRDPDEMYHKFCALEAKRHDPCVRDVFAAVVSHAEGAPARPWWEFTRERKAREANERVANERVANERVANERVANERGANERGAEERGRQRRGRKGSSRQKA